MELYKARNYIQLETLELKNKVALMLKKIITTLLLQMEGLTLLFFFEFSFNLDFIKNEKATLILQSEGLTLFLSSNLDFY